MTTVNLLKKLSIATAGTVLMTLGTAGASRAALITFSDRATFDIAAPGLTVEDFEKGKVSNGDAVGFQSPLDSTTNNSTFSTGDIKTGIQFAASVNGPRGLALTGDGFEGLTSKKLFANSFADTLNILFTNPVNAVGFDVYSIFSTSNITISIFGSNGLLKTSNVAANASNNFFGIISDTDLITKINLSSNSGQAEGIDNIAFGSSQSVPEPASVLGLLAFGALGAGSLKRKQQQKATAKA